MERLVCLLDILEDGLGMDMGILTLALLVHVLFAGLVRAQLHVRGLSHECCVRIDPSRPQHVVGNGVVVLVHRGGF